MQYRFVQENEIFIWSFISIFCSRRSVMIILNLSAAMSWQNWTWRICQVQKTSKTAVVLTAGVTISGTYSVPPSLHCTIWCQSTFGSRGQGLSNPTSFPRPALPILRPVQRYDNFKLKTSKTAIVLIAGVTISGTPCPRHFTVPFGAEAPSGHVDKAWAIPPPSWGLLSQWHIQQTTTPETN